MIGYNTNSITKVRERSDVCCIFDNIYVCGGDGICSYSKSTRCSCSSVVSFLECTEIITFIFCIERSWQCGCNIDEGDKTVYLCMMRTNRWVFLLVLFVNTYNKTTIHWNKNIHETFSYFSSFFCPFLFHFFHSQKNKIILSNVQRKKTLSSKKATTS